MEKKVKKERDKAPRSSIVFLLCCNARELTFLTLPRHDVMEYNQQQNNTIKNTPRGPGARSPRKS